jgi:hypothetical protein
MVVLFTFTYTVEPVLSGTPRNHGNVSYCTECRNTLKYSLEINTHLDERPQIQVLYFTVTISTKPQMQYSDLM